MTTDRASETDGRLASPIDDGPPIDWVRLDAHPRLDAGAPLDPERTRVEVAALHPDRLTPARPELQTRLETALATDPTPKTLAREINPGYWSSDAGEREGRLANCADCARAFQDGLDGRPRAAATIDERGLPLAEHDQAPGEAAAYTEQWAGRRAEGTTYAAVGDELRRSRGSAIVFGYGDGGGHAFNAYWDQRRGSVRWADAQAGTTGDWPPDEHAEQFPTLNAIWFDRRGGTR